MKLQKTIIQQEAIMSKAVQNTSELTTAIDDIRHKLVEEPWFGQSATENIEMAIHHLEGQSQSFSDFYDITPENENQSQDLTNEQQQQTEHTQQEQEL